ncbi:MAG: cation-translocating P-type ATPase [Vicinamibacterales bacterium]
MPESPSVAWYARPSDEVLRDLGSRPGGLTTGEAADRLGRSGPNVLPVTPPEPAWRILVAQFQGIVIYLLVAAAIVSAATGDPLDAAAIGVVLLLNAGIGFATELRARRAIEALSQLEPKRAVVLRDGQRHEIQARNLVPGDVVVVEAGGAVPADARVLVAHGLRVNESALTGESAPVSKDSAAVADDAVLADRRSMLFSGTMVADGTGRAVVTATGSGTELGRIGGLVGRLAEGATPLERRLDALGSGLVWIALAVAALVVVIGALHGTPVGEMIETGLALAVAAVPEGLPAVATIALAVGVRRMARRRALVRRLPSVESLGSVTIVCSDKTGTLTAGEMTATTVWTAGRTYVISGAGYAPDGAVTLAGTTVDIEDDADLALAVRVGALAGRGDARQVGGAWTAEGDPTDVALLVLGRKLGLPRAQLLNDWPEIGEVPFSSARRLMATFHDTPSGRTACVKGAPARVLEVCGTLRTAHGVEPLDEARIRQVRAQNETMAAEGLRVLALACGSVTEPSERALQGLAFVGLVGLIDPPAEGVRETITAFRDAGIRTVMITGDQRLTAEAVGRSLGLFGEGDQSMDGREVDAADDAALAAAVPRVAAYSRVSPEGKLRIVSAVQARGEVAAVLGDGVNDAAALKKADVGVAMGGRGTDVAREAADVVLQDDNFRTIVAAVEEGRVIADNIRKFVFYLFSCNLAEVLVLLGTAVAGLPLPLTPLQILWINLVTDTFPALALALEPGEPDVMRRRPRSPAAAILSRGFLQSVAFYAALITAATLAGYTWALTARPQAATTVAFMTLALAQVFHLGNARSRNDVLAPRRVVANVWAVAAVFTVLALQAVAVYAPAVAATLRTVPLDAQAWLVVLGLATLPAVTGQTLKRATGLRIATETA